MDKNHLAAAIKAVSAYVEKEFAGASILDGRDHDRSAHTWSVKPVGGDVLMLLTVSFERFTNNAASQTLPSARSTRSGVIG